MQLEDVRVLATGLAFPEGPVALEDGSLLVVEVAGGRLTCVSPKGEVSMVAEVGGGPNGAAVGPDGAVYLCNNGGLPGAPAGAASAPPSIQRVELDSGRTEVVYTGCDGRPFTSPNDLVFDRSGSFWFTDYLNGAVYYASPDGSSIRVGVEGLRSPNGVALSPAGDVLYWAQTETRQVCRRRLSSPGTVVPSPGYSIQAFVLAGEIDRFALLAGLPGARELDSMAVEEQGAVCVGTLIESGITVVSPDGDTVETVTLPDGLEEPAVTNICFGGPDMRTAYITLSLTGRVISCRWPRPGLRPAFEA